MTLLMMRVLETLEADGSAMTPNEIAGAMGLGHTVRRHGHGGKGGWSGYMAPAQRIIFPLNALRVRGLVDWGRRSDGLSGAAYRLTQAGREALQ